jgi:hypothetical protein
MGSFHLLPLRELVELLAARRATGELASERGTVRKAVTLADGVAVGAASNDPREYLGQLLINFGHIDEEQLAKAFETQQETRVRLGKVLTMVGLVSAEAVREALAIKIRETLLDVFTWDSGYFTFDEKARPALDDDAAVPLAEIAKEAEFRVTAWAAFRAAFPSGSDTLAVEEGAVRGVEAASVDGRLLRLAREGKSIDEIGLALHATDFHLYQRLYALQRRGAVRTQPSAPEIPAAVGDDPDELLARARQALASGKTAEAEAAAARALELAPAAPGGAELLAEARRKLAVELRVLLPRVPRLRVPAQEIALLHLSSAEKYLLARCDGGRDVAQLVGIAPLAEIEVLKAIRRFADGKVVDLR